MKTTERWKPIPGWEDLYQVSDTGYVRSLLRRDRNGRWWTGRILSDSDKGNGYRVVNLCRDGVSKTKTVHSLVLAAFRGPPPPGMECCHDDGTRSNNRLSNLRYDTSKGNQQDRRRHGTDLRGEKIASARLTIDEVRKIRELVSEGTTQREVARQFNVSQKTVWRVIHRENWNHVT